MSSSDIMPSIPWSPGIPLIPGIIDPQGDAFVDADTSPQSYRRLRGEPGGQIMAIGDTLTPISHAPASSRLVS